MKWLLSILMCALMAACSHPLPVTARPDQNVSTSGTAGTIRAENGVVRPDSAQIRPVDTLLKDSIRAQK